MTQDREVETSRSGHAEPRRALDEETRAIGREIAAALPHASHGPVATIDRYAMNTVADDASLRAALFRFVDVMPALESQRERAQYLSHYLASSARLPLALRLAPRAAHVAGPDIVEGALSEVFVRHLARRFIVGETPAEAHRVLGELAAHGIGFSVDLLGEATVTAGEADHYARRCRDALDSLGEFVRALPSSHRVPTALDKVFVPLNVSVKVSALTPHLRPQAPKRAVFDAAARLRPLLAAARDAGAHLHIDMESVDAREAVLDLVFTVLAEPEFADGPSVGVVVQAYLRDAAEELDRILAFAASTPSRPPLVVRLVKGAYWDHEVALALQRGWDVPVFEHKVESDRSFEDLTDVLLSARPGVAVAIASHNLRSIAHGLAENRRLGAADTDLEIQVLRGLGDDLALALASLGFRVRTYCPIGDLVSGMAYLVRRLLENTSNESFLQERARGVKIDTLLEAP